MLSHYNVTGVFDCVVHNYEKEEALESVDSFVLFFNAGWQKLLGIDLVQKIHR
jgi:hypothetical protein